MPLRYITHITPLVYLVYFIFAILLNSVGTVILQVINSYDVSKPEATILEACKDLSLAFVSFFIASYVPRIGFRRGMQISLAIVALACIAIPLAPSFLSIKLLFLATGTAFALAKISCYASAGLLTPNRTAHTRFINNLEGFFMVGVLAGYWLFGYFMEGSAGSDAWTNVYWPIAGLSVAVMIALHFSTLDESEAKLDEGNTRMQEFLAMLKLAARPMVYLFVISAFLYVLIEQGVGTWLPTFNNEILMLPAAMSVQVTSIFAACLAIGRLSAGTLLRFINWFWLLNICVAATAALVLLVLPLTANVEKIADVTWSTAPIAAFLFPIIGLFMAPIYPTINSVVLTALPKKQHASMTGLMVIFSALGGTTGSIITGFIFDEFEGATAFEMALIPLSIILISLFFFKREIDKLGDVEVNDATAAGH